MFDDIFHEYIEIGIKETKLVIDQLYKEVATTKLYKSLYTEGIDMKHLALYVLLFHSIPIKYFPENQHQKIKDLRDVFKEETPLFDTTISFFKNQMKVTKELCCDRCDCKTKE